MKYILIIAGIIALTTTSFAREIALTFDDCPRKSGPLLNPMDRAKKLVDALNEAGVTAGFFCNSPSREIGGIERVRYFADHGHIIANHSTDHLDLHRVPIELFKKSIDQADAELRSLPNFRKWFRFPFLHEGKTPQDVEAIRAHLEKRGYVNGYVTVDTQDWYVDEVLRQKVFAGKRFEEARLCQTYARMMTDDADFFDVMSVGALGRSVKHVLLLHETDLNAICLSALIGELKRRNWSIISPDVAYVDPIALMEPKSTTKLNQGRVFALAKETAYAGPWYSKWNEESEIEKELDRQQIWH